MRVASGPGRRLADDSSVTPILGSVLILGITIVGIAAILVWGAPAIQAIQDQNAQVTMVGEFLDVRLSALALSVPDASRTPIIVLPDGSIAIEPGTRFLVAAGLDPANPACDLHVTGWDAAPGNAFTLAATGCRTPVGTATCASPPAGSACLEVAALKGSTRIPTTVSVSGTGPYTITLAGSPTPDLTDGDWDIRITNGQPTNPVTYAHAVIITSLMHTWQLGSDRAVHHDGGGVFTRTLGATYVEAPPALREDAFGTGETVFWLRSMVSQQEASFTGRGDYTVTLALVGSHVRISGEANQVRYDFAGSLAPAWCGMLLARNDDLAGEWYTGTCGGVPSVVYAPGASFPFEFLDAHITTSIRP